MNALRFVGFLLIVIAAAATSPAQTTQPVARTTVDVWPAGKMPGKGSDKPEGEWTGRKPDGFHRITDVSRPTLSVFPAPKAASGAARPAPAMLVCPGGGYNYVVIDKEGTEIAAWLNAAGISAVVLKYRVPNNREGALQDVQRAISLTRANAGEWNIDPKRLGMIGFSAGGHLAARASTAPDRRRYDPVDAADRQSCRPDFAVLVYPAYLAHNGHVAQDLHVTANVPPTLIVHSEDDEYYVPGSKLYHAALDEAKAPNQFLLYQTGGHGYGLHCERDARAWPEATLQWLRKTGDAN